MKSFFLTRNMVVVPDMDSYSATPENLPVEYRVEEQYGTSVTILQTEFEEDRTFAAEERPAHGWSWKGILNFFSR